MVNAERILNFSSEWIHSTSILDYLNSPYIENRFLCMDNLIEELVAKLLVGPN